MQTHELKVFLKTLRGVLVVLTPLHVLGVGGDFYTGAVWAPVLEGTILFTALLFLVFWARMKDKLGGTWGEEFRNVFCLAAVIGLGFAVVEQLFPHQGDNFLLRLAAFPTYNLAALAAALLAFNQKWRGAFWGGVAISALVHGLFNNGVLVGLPGYKQGYILLVAYLGFVVPTLHAAGKWAEAPPGWKEFTTLPPRTRSKPAQVAVEAP